MSKDQIQPEYGDEQADAERDDLRTGGGACGHLTAPFARPGACTRASHRGGDRVQGTGRSERGRGRDRSRGRGRRREWGRGRERGRER